MKKKKKKKVSDADRQKRISHSYLHPKKYIKKKIPHFFNANLLEKFLIPILSKGSKSLERKNKHMSQS